MPEWAVARRSGRAANASGPMMILRSPTRALRPAWPLDLAGLLGLFGASLRSFNRRLDVALEVLDPLQLAARLLHYAVAAHGASGGAVVLDRDGVLFTAAATAIERPADARPR